MRQLQQTITINTDGVSLTEFTETVAEIVEASGIEAGLAHFFAATPRHRF